ncbi:hypothetical protein ACF0H5_003515 [Mactra antiquata]
MASTEKAEDTPSRGRPKLTSSTYRKNNELRNRSRIIILDEIDRWLFVKESLKLKTHCEVARVLLDAFLNHGPRQNGINSRAYVPITREQHPSTSVLEVSTQQTTQEQNATPVMEETDYAGKQTFMPLYGRHMEYEDTDARNNVINTNVGTSNEDNHSLSSGDETIYEENVIIKTEPDLEATEFVSENDNKSERNSNVNLAEQNFDLLNVPFIKDENNEKELSSNLLPKGVQPKYAFVENWNEDNGSVSDKDEAVKSSDENADDMDIDKEMVAVNPLTSLNQNCSKIRKGKRKLVEDPEKDAFSSKKGTKIDDAEVRTSKWILVEDPDFKADEFECPIETISVSETDNRFISDDSKDSSIKDSKGDDGYNEVRKSEAKKSKPKKNDELESSEVKKPKKKSKTPVKKPWISIKLEDHPEKYRIESVGSFERRNRGSNIVEELYFCLKCGHFKSIDKNAFEKHIEQHVNGVLECNMCDYVGRTEAYVWSHKKLHGHMGDVPTKWGKKHVCDKCGVVTYTKDARLAHMGREHGELLVTCKYCGGKFATRQKRLNHARAEHEDLCQYCNICRTSFYSSTPEEYFAHKSTCKPGHPCHICGKKLCSKDSLGMHIKYTHMKIRKYQCDMCQYAAKNIKRLREHKLMHTSSHPFSCDQCSFTCVQECQLKSHQRTHTGDKPYKCTQCNFAAAWNVQLKDHVKVHSMNTAVLCEPCNIFFKNDKAKKMHEKKEH